MPEFNPPIHTRETEELIAIAHSSQDEWQQSAIDQAIDELLKREVTIEDQEIVLGKWRAQARQLEIEYQIQLKKNETEGYSPGNMVYIFLVAPFILIGKWTVELSLRELKNENYQKKFRQRLFLLLSGTTFWVLFLVVGADDYTQKRQAEIDNVDISEWEKDRLPLEVNDTLNSSAISTKK